MLSCISYPGSSEGWQLKFDDKNKLTLVNEDEDVKLYYLNSFSSRKITFEFNVVDFRYLQILNNTHISYFLKDSKTEEVFHMKNFNYQVIFDFYERKKLKEKEMNF